MSICLVEGAVKRECEFERLKLLNPFVCLFVSFFFGENPFVCLVLGIEMRWGS
jgi:hypothetical protein